MGRTPKRKTQLQKNGTNIQIFRTDEYKQIKKEKEELQNELEKTRNDQKCIIDRMKEEFQIERDRMNEEISDLTKLNKEFTEQITKLKEYENFLEKRVDDLVKEKQCTPPPLLNTSDLMNRLRRSNSEFRNSNKELTTNVKILEEKIRQCEKQNLSMSSSNTILSDKITELQISVGNQDKTLPFSVKKPFSKLKNNEYKAKRSDYVVQEIEKMANEENIKPFLLALNNRIAYKNHRMSMKLTVQQMFDIKAENQFSYNQIEHLKKKLKQAGCFDSLPSIHQLRALEDSLSRVDLFDFIIKENLKTKKKILVLVVNDLQKLIGLRMCDLETSGKIDCDIECLKFTLVGDKGGGTTKISLIFGDIDKSNSPLHLQLLGLYEGKDNQREILQHLGKLVDEVNKLSSITYKNSKGRTVTKKVELSLTGDYMFLCEVLGHQGPASRYHCCLCYYDNDRSKGNRITIGSLDTSKIATLRTVASYEQHSPDGVLGVRRNSRVIFNIISLCHLIPPSLHILMGVIQKYVIDILVKIAKQLDCETDIEREILEKTIENDEALAIIDVHINNLKIAISIWKKSYETTTEFMILLKNIDQVRRVPSVDAPPCDHPGCCLGMMFEEHDYESEGWIDCESCKKTFHTECVGIFDYDELFSLKNGKKFKCYTCLQLSHDDVLKTLIITQAKIFSKLRILKELLETFERSRSNVVTKMGPLQKKLEETFKDIGAQRQAYYTQSFNGNHMKMLMKDESIQKIFAVFPDNDTMRELKVVMSLFGKIQKSTVARELTQMEISTLQENIEELMKSMKVAMPNETVTPKLHFLLFHVIPYVKTFKTWGKTSEQVIEHSHSQIAKLQHRNAAIQDLQMKWKTIVKQLCFMNVVADRS